MVSYKPEQQFVFGMCPYCAVKVRFEIQHGTDPLIPGGDELYCAKCDGWYEPKEVMVAK